MRKESHQQEKFNNESKKSGLSEGLSSFGEFLWNSNTNEFLGRDGESWGKIYKLK